MQGISTWHPWGLAVSSGGRGGCLAAGAGLDGDLRVEDPRLASLLVEHRARTGFASWLGIARAL